jgi:DNA-binding NarL/FixJ family response regulator
MNAIRVLIADDHNLVRAGIRSLLETVPEIQVVGEASNGREALQMIEVQKPDVVLMDIAMSELNGLEATSRVAGDFPQVRVIILSMHANEEYVWQALRAGAAGYLLKDAGTSELELAIKAVARGETYLSPPISKQVIADYVQRIGGEGEKGAMPLGEMERLTIRQREILRLIARGHTTQDIAQTLNISVKTVETHRSQLMERLGIHDIAGLVRYAIRVGLINPDE